MCQHDVKSATACFQRCDRLLALPVSVAHLQDLLALTRGRPPELDVDFVVREVCTGWHNVAGTAVW